MLPQCYVPVMSRVSLGCFLSAGLTGACVCDALGAISVEMVRCGDTTGPAAAQMHHHPTPPPPPTGWGMGCVGGYWGERLPLRKGPRGLSKRVSEGRWSLRMRLASGNLFNGLRRCCRWTPGPPLDGLWTGPCTPSPSRGPPRNGRRRTEHTPTATLRATRLVTTDGWLCCAHPHHRSWGSLS